MWFRRLLRRWREPPPPLLPSLDRLAELIERVVALLDQVALAPPPEPPRETHREGNVLIHDDPEPVQDGWIAFVASPDGYRLLERDGTPPAGGAVLELDGEDVTVLRLGPSPFPGDRRRCAFLEREEPSSAERSFDR